MHLLHQELCLLSKFVINREGLWEMCGGDVTSEHHVARLPPLVCSFQEVRFDCFFLLIRESLWGKAGSRLL